MNKKIIQQIWLPILFVLTCLFAVQTNAYAQTIRLTINMKDVPMEQVMTEIEKQTRYLFAINDGVDVKQTVSVEAENQTLQNILNQMVKGKEITYQISGSNIVLNKQTVQGPVEVTGVVLDPKGQPVIGAAVIVKGTTLGTSTGVDGSYTLRIPPPRR